MAEFEKEIHEESSLTLKERIDEFLENLSLKWQEFLDWSDEKGLPLRKVNNFFEEKGIPALPAMLVMLILILAGAYLAFLSVSGPVSKTFSISVRDAENVPVSGASVQLQFTGPDGSLQTKTGETDADGKLSFANIPATRATVAVHAADYEAGSKQATIAEGEESKLVTVTLTRVDNPTVAFSATITGPESADVLLFAGNGSLLEVQNFTAIGQFQVLPNDNYTIVSRAPGYREESRVVQLGGANLNVLLRMFREGEERTAPIYARVYLTDGLTPIQNATVKILDELTGAVLASGETGGDGASQGLEVTVGRNISIQVSREGFLSWFLPTLTVTEPEVSVIAKLNERTEENSKNIVLRVIDDNGATIESPHIALYCGGEIEQRDPRDGIAGFDVAIGTTCLASVSKEGFLPTQREITSAVEQNIILHTASSSNSGTLVVETLDKNGNSVAGVDVALLINGNSLGITKQSGIDGKAEFEHLPLGNLTVVGSTTGLEGTVDIEVEPIDLTGIEGKDVVLLLLAAKVDVEVEVIDHFGRQPITNAAVKATDSDGNVTSCTTVNGLCLLKAEIGSVSLAINAAGFEPLSTQFDVVPGENLQHFELISTDVSQGTELQFIGVFNEDNQRVSVLSPASKYSAKYLLKSPPIGFTTAKAFVQIGDSDVELDNLPAVITGFSSSQGAKIVGGIDYSSADAFETGGGSLQLVREDLQPVATQNLDNDDLTPLPSTSGTSASVSSSRFKWAAFTVDAFEGTKELKVFLQTSAVPEANVELFHRTEYNVPLANGSTEVFRSPADPEAGASRSPLLANLAEPNILPIHFEGKCTENMCIELWFEGSTGRQSAFEPFEAVVPETFKLSYRVLTPPQPLRGTTVPITLSLQTDSDAIQVGENQSTASRQVSAGGEGFFALKATRYSNDVPLEFTATGQGAFEEELHVSVSNAGNELRTSLMPSQLVAFEPNAVSVVVTDKFGATVQNARVVFEKGANLASQVEATEERPGRFTAELTPISFGEVSYTVQAEGFRAKKGKVLSIAKNLVSIQPTAGLAVSADSFDPTEGSSFTITNLVPNREVKISISVLPDGSPKYSVVSVSEGSFSLKGGESKTVSLVSNIKDSIIPFSANPATLKENYTGKISLNAKVVGFSQTTNLNFVGSAVFQQQPLSQLLDYSTDSIAFSLDLPRTPRDHENVKVTNNAGKPILINQQSTLLGVHVTPASAVIAPGGTASFNVTGAPSPQVLGLQCVFEDVSEKGKIEFIASFQGITNSKTVDVDVQVTSHTRCIVPGGMRVTLPFDANFVFPPGTIAAKNPAFDGSQAVKLPNFELVVFNQGSQVTDQRAYLPTGSPIELGGQHIALQGEDVFEVRFPFHAVIGVPPGAQQTTLPDGSIQLSTPVVQVILPPGLQQAFQGGTTFSSPSDPNSGFKTPLDYQRFGSFFGTRSSYALPAFTPVKVVATRQAVGEEFGITYDEEAFVDFPADGQVQASGSSVTAVFSSCTQLQVYSKVEHGKQIRDVLPAARQATITQATLTGKTARVSPGGKITLQTCADVTEDVKLFQTKLRAPVTFVLPPGAPDPRRTGMDASFPNCAELVYKSGYSLGIAKAKKIKFPQNAEVKEPLENGAREIEVIAGETVSFSPCASATPSVSSFAGLGIEAITSTNAPLVFTFTEGDIGKTITSSQTICLVNNRPSVLSPISATFISSVQGSMEAQEAQLKIEPAKTHVRLELSPSVKRECNNEFKLTAIIPASVYENACISKPGEYTGVIRFAAKDSTGWKGPAELPVTISVKSGKQCKAEHEKQASVILRSFFVDYQAEEDNVNERTGKPFVFTFKGTGPNHLRVLTLLNNFDSPASLQVNVPQSLSCNFPASIQAGDAISVQCAPQRITNGLEQLKITATPTNGGNGVPRSVNVQVFNGDPAIYQNSSWGEIAPQAVVASASRAELESPAEISFADDAPVNQGQTITADPVGTVRRIAGEAETFGLISQCSRHYCTYSQAQKAFDEFLGQMSKIAREKLESQETHAAFCAPGANAGQYHKTTIIHLANTKQDFANYVRSANTGIPYSVEAVSSITGCGIFKITASLDLCSGTALGATTTAERIANSKLQITGAARLAECSRTIANAPLFLASKEDALRPYIGTEIGLTKHSVNSFKDLLGVLSFGPYSNSSNEVDKGTISDFLKTVYGEPLPTTTVYLPYKYEQGGFCLKRGLEQLGIIGAGGTALAGAAALTGLGAGFGARLGFAAGNAALTCGFTLAGQGLATLLPGEQGFVCPAVNGCLRSAIFGALSTIVPGGSGFAAAAPSTKAGWVAYGGLVAGSTVGAEAWNSFNGQRPDIPPGEAGPVAGAGTRTIAAGLAGPLGGSSFEDQFNIIRQQHPDLQRVFRDSDNGRAYFKELLKAEKAAPGLGTFTARHVAATAGSTLSSEGRLVLQREVSALAGNVRNVKAAQIALKVAESLTTDRRVVEQVYKDLVKAKVPESELYKVARNSIANAYRNDPRIFLGKMRPAKLDALLDAAAPGTAAAAAPAATSAAPAATTTPAGGTTVAAAGTRQVVVAPDGTITVTSTSGAAATTPASGGTTGAAPGTPATTPATTPAAPARQALRLSQLPEFESALLKDVEETSKTALKEGATVEKVSRVGKLKGFGKVVLPAAGQIAAQLLLDVDVRPVQVIVPPSAKNVLVVYHIENPFTATTLPSVYKLCFADQNGQCENNYFYLANVCNSDTDACVFTHSLPNRGSDSYLLLVVVNNQNIAQKQFFDSLMFPEAPPLEKALLGNSVKVGQLPQDQIAFLKEDDSDNGDETALSGEASSRSVPDNAIIIGG